MVSRSFLLPFLFSILLVLPAAGQQDGVLQLDSQLERFLLRQQAAGLLPDAHLTHLPLSAYEARAYLDSLNTRRPLLSLTDRQLLDRYRYAAPAPGAEWASGLTGFAYANGHDFFSVEGDDFALQLNPLLYLQAAYATTQRGEVDTSYVTWQNTRGLRLSGQLDIGPTLFVESRLEENQRRVVWPEFEKKSAPRLGRTKFYPESQQHDYFRATGLVGVRGEHIEVRAGRDRNLWGPGATSVVLSDYAPLYDQLQIRTSFWRIQYTNLFAALTDLASIPGSSYSDQVLPRRYAAMHRLAVNLPAGVEIGLSEVVVFAPDPEGVRNDGFDLSYLNPVIFYRAVEHDRGSPDNAMIGADVSWQALRGLRLYGEFLLDELVVSELTDTSWRNKWAYVVGAETAGWVPGLHLRVEHARMRPYLYSHKYPRNAYLQNGDLLGHPAGPNAVDWALHANYRPHPRWHGALDVAYTIRGRNTEEVNYGSDPALSYNSRPSNFGIETLQGVRVARWLVEARAGVELLPRMWLEGMLRAEIVDDAELGRDGYVEPGVLLRWGLPFQSRRW